MARRETFVRDGYKYSRFPESKDRRHWYFQNYSKSVPRFLHVAIWEEVHGKVPSGYVVHHKNEVLADNRIRNLECISHDGNILCELCFLNKLVICGHHCRSHNPHDGHDHNDFNKCKSSSECATVHDYLPPSGPTQ